MSDTYAYFQGEEGDDFGSGGPRDVNVNWEKVEAQGQPKGGDDAVKIKGISDYQEEHIRANLRLQEGAPPERQGWYDWLRGNPDKFELEVQKVKAEKDKEGRKLSPERLRGNLATFYKEGIRKPTYDPKRTQAVQGKIRFAPHEQEHQIPKLFNLKNVGHDQAVIEKNKLGDGSPKEVYKAVYDEVVKQDKDRNSGWFNRIRHDLHDDDEAPGYTAPRDTALETVDEYANRVATKYLNTGYADEPGIPTGLGKGMTRRDEAALQKLWLERRHQSYRRGKQEGYDYAAQAKSAEQEEADAELDQYQDPDFGGGRKTKKRKTRKKTKRRKKTRKKRKIHKRKKTKRRRKRIKKRKTRKN